MPLECFYSLPDSIWLQKLYTQRVQPVSPPIWNLSRWLDGVTQAGWQTFEELFKSNSLALAFRAQRVRGIENCYRN